MSQEQTGNAITFHAFFVASKLGKTGLTVTVDVHEVTEGGTATEIVTAGSATETGDGLYRYRLTSGNVDAIGEYICVFKTADATVDAQHIPSLWVVGRGGVENLDAAVSSRNSTSPPSAASVADAVWDETSADHVTAGSTGQKLSAAGAASDPLLNDVPGSYAAGTAGYALGRVGTAQIQTSAPVATDGTLSLIRGDDYYNADGRALTFTSANWPSLVGASNVTFNLRGVTATGSVVNATTARVELTAAVTSTFPTGRQPYDVQATLSNGHVVTLAQGYANVSAG